jgi:anion-transporting  ArsA/GET3 family ATPase
MHLLLKYDLASRVRDLSEELLALSRKAKRLQGLLREEDTCELVVVTLPEPAVLAETDRLIGRLRALALPVRHVVLNQVASADDVDSVRQRWPAIELLRVTRRERPIQGTADLEALTS